MSSATELALLPYDDAVAVIGTIDIVLGEVDR